MAVFQFLSRAETPSDTHSTHGSIGPGLHIHIRITDIHHLVEPDTGNLRHYLMHDCRVRFYRLSLSLAKHLDEPELAEKVTDKLLCALLIFVRGQCGDDSCLRNLLQHPDNARVWLGAVAHVRVVVREEI